MLLQENTLSDAVHDIVAQNPSHAYRCAAGFWLNV